MEHWIAGSQGLALALAAGALLAAFAGRGRLGVIIALVGIAAGAYLFGLSLTRDFGVAEIADSGHPAWPGWVAGAVFAGFSYYVWNAIAVGARAREGAALGVAAFIASYAIVLAVLSLVVPFVGLVAFVLTVWLWAGRRRRAGQKYEGLRVLR